ncbi:integral membrane protein PTH11 [Fusarium pseudoanthophilum]|uniref:Integral membrane protein PTH11 n=1 Tax=Fusarium pseudoanthophilum TaxID=48495 RepID=A0A8H5UW53_9HYPO|nr:integral membrane protein PTH11 [Fusarium pseudoanthophilum]
MHPLLLLATWTWFMSQVVGSDLSNFLTELPSCAESCVLDFVTASSCGTNATCLCTDPKLRNEVLPCVESHCLPREALAAINLTSVACDFPIRDKHEQFNILTITLIVITGITVGLRFIEKIRYGPGIQVDDYVISGAFLVNLGNSIVCLHGLSGNGLGRDAWTFSPDTITSYLCPKFLYAGQTLYATDVFATKICVLLFYLRIFPGVIIRRFLDAWDPDLSADSPPDEMEEETCSCLNVRRGHVCDGRQHPQATLFGRVWQFFQPYITERRYMVRMHAKPTSSDAQDISKTAKLGRRYTKKQPIQLIYSRAANKSTEQYSRSS